MQQVVAPLGIPLPPYTRRDAVCVSHTVKKAKSSNDTHSFSCTILVHSVHGPKCPLPLVQQVDISFEVLKDTVFTQCVLSLLHLGLLPAADQHSA